ncbi:MAG: hypothetical protein RLZZ450_6986 [Pseudomonadota bacterium]|jgi:outer membrane protein assembly factor BamB
MTTSFPIRPARSQVALLSAGLLLALSSGCAEPAASTKEDPSSEPPPSTSGTGGPKKDAAVPKDARVARTDSGQTSDDIPNETLDPTEEPTRPPRRDDASVTKPADSDPDKPVSEWRVMGYDVGSTYLNTAETVLTKENAARLEVAWQADMGDNVYGAPLQVGDVIYASSGTVVQAFNAADGKMLWRNTRAGTTAAMSYDDLDDGTLYLNNNEGLIVSLKASDGTQKWAKAPTTQTTDGSSSPVVAGDFVLIGGSAGAAEILGTSRFRGYVAAMKKTTGDVAWVGYTVPEGAHGASLWSTPSADLTNKRVYGATGNNHGTPNTDTSDAIIAFNYETGAIEWKNQRTKNDNWSGASAGPDHDFGANPVLYEVALKGVMTQMVSSAQKSGSAHGFRRDTGEMVWTRSLGRGSNNGSAGVFTNATWSGKHMLFACNGGAGAELFALDGATGEIAWQRTLGGAVYGRISVANGVGFVGAGTKLEVFDTDTGKTIKSIAAKTGTLASTITIANGRVAFGEGMSWNSARPGSTLTVLEVK